MSNSSPDELFVEPRGSSGLKIIGAVAALVITVLVFVGYAYLRKRHAADNAAAIAASPAPQPRPSPQALILVDEALLKGGMTTVAGTVRNISAQQIGPLSVAVELRKRKGGSIETKVIALDPAVLDSQKEARYSLQLKAEDYASARVSGLKAGSAEVPFTTGLGQKRPAERLESKTIVVDKPRGKGGDFLNTPDNPARVP